MPHQIERLDRAYSGELADELAVMNSREVITLTLVELVSDGITDA